MTEEELQKKRAEYRDQEVHSKISQFSQVDEYRKQVLKTNYTTKVVDKSFGKIGWFLIGSHATFIIFFSVLYIFTYIPHTKKIVTMVMP
jgi:hypothetical protein